MDDTLSSQLALQESIEPASPDCKRLTTDKSELLIDDEIINNIDQDKKVEKLTSMKPNSQPDISNKINQLKNFEVQVDHSTE